MDYIAFEKLLGKKRNAAIVATIPIEHESHGTRIGDRKGAHQGLTATAIAAELAYTDEIECTTEQVIDAIKACIAVGAPITVTPRTQRCRWKPDETARAIAERAFDRILDGVA